MKIKTQINYDQLAKKIYEQDTKNRVIEQRFESVDG